MIPYGLTLTRSPRHYILYARLMHKINIISTMLSRFYHTSSSEDIYSSGFSAIIPGPHPVTGWGPVYFRLSYKRETRKGKEGSIIA